MPETMKQATVTIENGPATVAAAAQAEIAATAAGQAVQQAAVAAAQAEEGAARKVADIASATVGEVNKHEEKVSQWLQEHQTRTSGFHSETKAELETLKAETGNLKSALGQISTTLTAMQALLTPKSQEPQAVVTPPETPLSKKENTLNAPTKRTFKRI